MSRTYIMKHSHTSLHEALRRGYLRWGEVLLHVLNQSIQSWELKRNKQEKQEPRTASQMSTGREDYSRGCALHRWPSAWLRRSSEVDVLGLRYPEGQRTPFFKHWHPSRLTSIRSIGVIDFVNTCLSGCEVGRLICWRMASIECCVKILCSSI